MKQPHKHAALIKAWADGAEIEAYDGNRWLETLKPQWNEKFLYRIKPEPKPDVVKYAVANRLYTGTLIRSHDCNLTLVFDGETGKLKKAEVLE